MTYCTSLWLIVSSSHVHKMPGSGGGILEENNIHVWPYLDNWLLQGTSHLQVLHQSQFILRLFDCLWLILNKEKSTLFLTHRLEFIRALLDSPLAKAFHPQERFWTIWELYACLRSHPSTMAQVCLILLGLHGCMYCECKAVLSLSISMADIRLST